MKYISTKGKSEKISFKEAVIKGMPEDKGLYFPERIPLLNIDFIKNIEKYSNEEIAYTVASEFLGDEIPSIDLKNIISKTLNFDIPLIELDKGLYSLELFHGPTLAFKDIGAGFMANCLNYFVKDEKIKIIVATSGDTGSAVANGFLGSENIDVFILYPSGKVSEFQEKQFTTLGKNITAIEVDGNFDDCQRIVKATFENKQLNNKFKLSTANSINIARLIPQIFYYFIMYKNIKDKSKDLYVSVPSGNFGNLSAGIIAKKMGLPITKFIASTNINRVVPNYIDTGIYTPKNSVATLSNAMDVGNPSNFERMKYIYKDNHLMSQDIIGYSFTDIETQEAMKKLYSTFNYHSDPHGAVGYLGAKKHTSSNHNCVFLETAHYSKFSESINYINSSEIKIPERVKLMMVKTKRSIKMENKLSSFIEILLKKNV